MTPLKDYPDAQKEIEIVPVNAIPSVVVDYPDFQREVEVIAGGESMSWKGQWNREGAYAIGATVRYEGHTYVCIEPIAAVVGITGLGPPAEASGPAHWKFPGGRPAPVGRIAGGQQFGGTLRKTTPGFEQFDTNIEDPEHPGKIVQRADAWEFWVKEPHVKSTCVGFGVAGPNGRFKYPGLLHATIGNDSGKQFKAEMCNTNGEMTEALFELPEGATKSGGNERYYLIVWGSVWQETGALPNQKDHTTLPLPYALTPGAGIVSGAGSPPPPEDFEHWALVA